MKSFRIVASLTAALLTLPVPSRSADRKLVVCNDVAEPPTLDAHKEFGERNHVINQQIYDGLVRFDPQGRIEPALATSWKRLDSLKVRFHLRQNVKFHNGETFDAEAVRFSIARLLDPKTGFPGLGLMSSLSHAEVVDPHTVDIVTRYPDSLLLRRLAALFLVVPPRALKETGESAFTKHPVGTGAFRFKDWVPGAITLEANRDYWMKGYPKAEELVFRYIPAHDQLGELFAGRLDVLFDLPGTKTMEVQSHPEAEVRKGRTFYTISSILRFDRGPLADRRVRQALNYAIDRKSLVRYDLLGNGEPLNSMSMPGEVGHDPSLKPYAYDPKKAAALLADAGYPKGFELNAMIKVGAERLGKIFAADWKEIGVTLNIDVWNEAQMFEFIKNPKYDIAIGEIPDQMSHIYFITAMIVYSKSPFVLAKDPAFDALFEKMVSTLDEAKSEELARAVDRYIHDEALSIFTYQKLRLFAVRKGLKFDHYITGTPYLFSAGFESWPKN
ncbi:MAG: ABC transporter substrate-binding protein [Proteobacteria bacterium]|nr:ABC transporter substrate-binding protein [Pseudomonadota bacterium]